MSNERRVELQKFRIELDEQTAFTDRKKNVINQKIKSIVIGRFSNPNIFINAKFKEGDEVTLWPGRVINLNEASQGVILSWEAYSTEWIEIDISENEHLIPFTPPQSNVLVSNVASKTVSKIIEVLYSGFGEDHTLILEANPNRIRVEIESFHAHRLLLGESDNTLVALANSVLVEKNEAIMPFSKKIITSTEAIYAISDPTFISMYYNGVGAIGGSLKVTEFLK